MIEITQADIRYTSAEEMIAAARRRRQIAWSATMPAPAKPAVVVRKVVPFDPKRPNPPSQTALVPVVLPLIEIKRSSGVKCYRERIGPLAGPTARYAARRMIREGFEPWEARKIAFLQWHGIQEPRSPQEPQEAVQIKTFPLSLIIDSVCKFYAVKQTDVLSARRTKNVVKPRQVAMYLCKVMTLKSLPYIGRVMAGRDHTTVLHGVRKIGTLIETDEKLAADVAAITAMVEAA